MPPPALPPPRKRFGQNFLTDRRVLERIVEVLAPAAPETIVEIGPGRGALTDVLVERGLPLVAIEIDRDLVRHLRERYAGRPGVTILEGDVLARPIAHLAPPPLALVGNVPYYLTTPILFHALAAPRPRRIVVLVQREVAERLAARPGDRTYGALTANVNLVADVEVVGRVQAGAFHPRPKVDSSIVRLTPRAEPACTEAEEAAVRALVIALFGQRRRQVVRGLRTVTGLDATHVARIVSSAAIAPADRPEVLDAAAFVRLSRALTDAT